MPLIPPQPITEIDPTVYHSLFATLQVPILFIDAQTAVILDANPAACAFYGYTYAELIGKTIIEISALTEEETRQRVSQIAAGQTAHMHTRHRLANGEIRDVAVALGRHLSGEKIINIAVINDITEQVRAEKKLQESEEDHRLLFENMQEGFALQEIIQDENGQVVDFRILNANPAYEHHTGQKLDEIVGHTLREVMPNADPAMIERYGQVALTGKPLDFEYHSKTFDRHIRVRSFRPQPNHFATIFEDITERKQAEYALQVARDELEQHVAERTAELNEAQQWLKSAIRAAKIGLWDWVICTNRVIYSPEYKRMLGYQEQEFSDDFSEWERRVHPEDLGPALARVNAFIQHPDGDYWNEFRMQHKDGSYRWILAQGSIILDDHGQLLRMLGSHIDITELKQVEAEMHLRGQLIALTYEPIFTWDLEKGIQFWNEGCQKLYGFSREEALGRNPHALLSTIHPTTLENVIGQLQMTGRWEGELQQRSKDGDLIVVESHQELIGWEGQRLVLESNRNITERKQAEEKLAETNTALEKALHVKDEFMAAMSHELRTPLTGILGMAEALQVPYYGGLTEKQRKAVDIIETNGNRLLTVINDVLDYSHLQSGGIAVHPKPCDLADTCQSALQMIEPTAAKKRQQTNFTIEPGSITLTTDKQLILQLLKYLLENASKFTAEAGEFGIEVSGNQAEKLVRLSVWDKGIGIQEQDFPRLFQPFVQLDARFSRPYDGTGLGLVLVKQITELLGGSVGVQSVFGQGSCFTVTLPWLD